MLNAEQCFWDSISAPVRKIRARAELYNGSALINTFRNTDSMQSISIERVGEESKFFGFGICQKLNLKLRDINRELDISTANSLDIAFGAGCDYIYAFPLFNVTEVHRNENTNELSITAYDALDKASAHTVAEVGLVNSTYSIYTFAEACAAFLGLTMKLENVPEADYLFNLVYEGGANFDGTESIREALNAIAEATQTIYYINNNWQLVFKRLDIEGGAVASLTKANYFTLDSKTNRRLATIAHVTELGDNVSISTAASGSAQYVRNNPFWDLREDISSILEAALANVGGLLINQFSAEWRGNYLVEIGDKVAITTKDGAIVYSYLLNDSLNYDGGLSQETEWSFEDAENESESNASNLGDALKQTFARVDKANKEIALVVSDTAANNEAISSLQMDTNSISASVQSMEEATTNALQNVTSDIATLTNKVDAAITAENVEIAIRQELSNGVEKVVTKTGFVFDEQGLTVSKTGSEMATTITEDGMTVYRDTEAVLTANNTGVNAVNLHATTYLIIGTNSRLENYGDNRTGCFWIGN